MLGLSTVEISAKSVRSIEQPSAAVGRGLGAMPPMRVPVSHHRLSYGGTYKSSRAII